MRHMTILVMILAAADFAQAAIPLESPWQDPSSVDETGALTEDWGAVAFRVSAGDAQPVIEQRAETAPMPSAITTLRLGNLTAEQTAFRAPIWPGGVDVVHIALNNTGAEAVDTLLRLETPPEVTIGAGAAYQGGRAVVGLPKDLAPVLKQRPWGCKGGAVLAGWGRPSQPCDPAFNNIRAGMTKEPIIYQFAVPAGAERTVAMGLCESHWSLPGQRPLMLYVEGAPRQAVDPLARWGRNIPGVVVFQGRDVNNDGSIQVVSAADPASPDQIPILNAIWVFSPDVFVEAAAVMAGGMSAQAEYYVDAGGEKDQSLYEGESEFAIRLEPGASRELTFLVASPGCASVPAMDKSAWDYASLRKAAADVWTAKP